MVIIKRVTRNYAPTQTRIQRIGFERLGIRS